MRFRSSARPHSKREEKLLSLGEKYGKGFLAQNHLNFDKWKKKNAFFLKHKLWFDNSLFSFQKRILSTQETELSSVS